MKKLNNDSDFNELIRVLPMRDTQAANEQVNDGTLSHTLRPQKRSLNSDYTNTLLNGVKYTRLNLNKS